MGTGFQGTFVISWSQTELDGQTAAPLSALTIGASWRWLGVPLRVDGPQDVFRLERSGPDVDLRRRASRVVHRLVGAAVTGTRPPEAEDLPDRDRSFDVTDGLRRYTVTLIEVPDHPRPLLMFTDELPPVDTELWVLKTSLEARPTRKRTEGLICFTPGTRIRTARGDMPVQTLRPGDKIQTKDNGLQELLWLGAKRMSGGRLYANPDLRPVRIHAGAFGIDRPDNELLVSPDHRVLFQGRVAEALFNAPEVLVAARDLVNWTTVSRDITTPEILYIHLLLPQHEVLFANGVETESFHPGGARLDLLEPEDRARLCRLLPGVAEMPERYGAPARRMLSPSEAALLSHKAA